jgi:protein gp37
VDDEREVWTYCDDVLRGFRAHKNGGWTDPRNAVQWVIAGGESGPRARPAHPDWFRSLRDQCAAAGVPFHFKQWGEFVSVSEVGGPGAHHTFSDGNTVRRTGKKLAGRRLEGVEHNGFPA